MGKRVGKRAVLAAAKARAPDLDANPKLNFKEAKKMSILAGLRVLKAPAVT